jgi:hypothetical protein
MDSSFGLTKPLSNLMGNRADWIGVRAEGALEDPTRAPAQCGSTWKVVRARRSRKAAATPRAAEAATSGSMLMKGGECREPRQYLCVPGGVNN